MSRRASVIGHTPFARKQGDALRGAIHAWLCRTLHTLGTVSQLPHAGVVPADGMERTRDTKRRDRSRRKVVRCTGAPSHASGVANQRNASAICSGGVVTRNMEVDCSAENATAPTETARERLKRLTEMKANLNRMYLQAVLQTSNRLHCR